MNKAEQSICNHCGFVAFNRLHRPLTDRYNPIYPLSIWYDSSKEFCTTCYSGTYSMGFPYVSWPSSPNCNKQAFTIIMALLHPLVFKDFSLKYSIPSIHYLVYKWAHQDQISATMSYSNTSKLRHPYSNKQFFSLGKIISCIL